MNYRAFVFIAFASNIGCADPIIGDWTANEICDATVCYALPLNQDGVKLSVTMNINEDLEGTILEITESGSVTETQATDVTISVEGDAEYELSQVSDQGVVTKIMCTLKEDELDCFDDDNRSNTVTFEAVE